MNLKIYFDTNEHIIKLEQKISLKFNAQREWIERIIVYNYFPFTAGFIRSINKNNENQKSSTAIDSDSHSTERYFLAFFSLLSVYIKKVWLVCRSWKWAHSSKDNFIRIFLFFSFWPLLKGNEMKTNRISCWRLYNSTFIYICVYYWKTCESRTITHSIYLWRAVTSPYSTFRSTSVLILFSQITNSSYVHKKK